MSTRKSCCRTPLSGWFLRGLAPRPAALALLRGRHFSLVAGLALACSLNASAVIVDRAAITVGTKVITESEIIRRIRLAAFQNGVLPDFSAASRREAAQHLVDLKLVEREMELGHYDRTPREQAQALLAAFTTDHFRSDAEALRISLAGSGLTPEDLSNELAEQADLLSFLNLRFRPAVEISDQDVEKYYRENIATIRPAAPAPLSEVRANIEQILTAQRADRDLDTWLQDERKRTRIVYLEGDLQ